MAERINQGPEVAKNVERLEAAGAELEGKLGERLNAAAEKEPGNKESLDEARHEALELAARQEDELKAVATEKAPEKQPTAPTKAARDAAFNKTMNAIRKDMNPAERAFSKVIHNPVVSKASDAVGNTIARPNLILAGALGTLILCSIVFIVAKVYGYAIDGFWAIGTFIAGWAIGAVIEFARVGLRNSSKS